MEEKKFLVSESKLQVLFDLIGSAKFDIPFGSVNSAIHDFNKSIVEFEQPKDKPQEKK